MSSHETNGRLGVGDNRTVRDILIDIEKKVVAATSSAKEEPRVLTYPSTFNERTTVALDIVFDELARTRRKMSYTDIINEVNRVEPGLLRHGGDVNESIRSYCAERCGVLVRWGQVQIGRGAEEARRLTQNG